MQTPWFSQAIKPLNTECKAQAQTHQNQLTKPPGALGRLEDIATLLAAMQKKATPEIKRVQISVFAADHGIAAQGVSAFPQAVTAEMIKNFSRGGAAINVLARSENAKLNVINMGTVTSLPEFDNVINKSIANGTRDFSNTTAMTQEECEKALQAGADIVDQAHQENTDLFIAGEMGIANTSSATALVAVLLKKDAVELCGPGTGLDETGVNHKADIINKAIKFHQDSTQSGEDILFTFGGFEIAAIVGSYIRCAQLGITVLVDGFITTAAALIASHINPGCEKWFIYSHASAEPGHKIMMQALKAVPLLDLGMRLGEGSGAAIALPLIKNACRLHAEMATFADAGVSEKSN